MATSNPIQIFRAGRHTAMSGAELAFSASDLAATAARSVMRPPVFVDAEECADNLLPLMRKHHRMMLIVRAADSQETLGIITEANILILLTSTLKDIPRKTPAQRHSA